MNDTVKPGALEDVNDSNKKEPRPIRAIDKAKAHYSQQDRQRIEVPEWGLAIFARPMTLADTSRALTMRGDDPKRWYPACIVQMAEDGDGEKLFSFTEIDDLVANADARVISRVGAAITGDKITPEDHEGN